MRRHWEAEHRASNFGSMSAAERKDAIDRLSGNLQKTTSFFRKQTAEADKIVRASYDVSRILARWMKPFSDGDFIKECHVAVVDSVCPEQRSVFDTVSLWSRTVRRRIEEMSQFVCVPDDVEPDTCVMREEFASRFAGMKPLAADFKLFTAPLTFPWTTPLHMELVELQCNDELKAKFYNVKSSPMSFFRDIALPSRIFHTFIAHVQRVVAMLRTALLQNEVHEVSPSVPPLGPPSE